MVREEDFHPTFGDIVLGETTVAEAWDIPGALAGGCGRPPEYFERTTGPSTAEPRVRALGLKESDDVDETDLGLLCDSQAALTDCGGELFGDAELAEEAVDCFLNTPEGGRLRQRVRPNIYAESAPFQPLDYSLINIYDPEIMSAEG
jgi:hypothetical protein